MRTTTTTTRRLRRLVALPLAAASLLLTTGAAHATTYNGGQLVSSGVGCSHANRTMDVSAASSQMYNVPAYVNGQWVRYRVYTRDVTSTPTAWAASTGWSAWVWVNGTTRGGTFNTYDTTSYRAVPVGTTRLYGTAGHSYQAAVAYDWWMGSDAVGYDFNLSYTESYSYFYFNPSRCVF